MNIRDTIKKRRRLIIPLGVFALSILIILSIFIWRYTLRTSYNLVLSAGTGSTVIIQRDNSGMPLIKALNIDDMYLALGYIHAIDRYPQMEYLFSIVNSSTSSFIDRKGEQIDVLSELIGFKKKAYVLFSDLSPSDKSRLESYVKGINLGRIQGHYDLKLEKQWTPEDVIAVLYMKEWANAFLNNRELIAPLPSEMHNSPAVSLIPENLRFFYDKDEQTGLRNLMNIKKIVKRYMGSFCRGYAFAIPGNIAEAGSPVVAFSYEDEISQYPGWYPVHVEMKGYLYKMLSYAGLPFFYAGKGPELTFASVSLSIDVQDFISEAIDRSNGMLNYLTQAGWAPAEAIASDSADSKTTSVTGWNTPHGPLLDDIYSKGELYKKMTALRGIEPSSDFIACNFELPFASSLNDAAFIVKKSSFYPRAYIMSDLKDIETVYTGRVANSPKSNSVFLDGYSAVLEQPKNILTRQVKNESVIKWISSGLNDEGLANYADKISDNPFRGARLESLLTSREHFSGQDIEDILLDQYSMTASRVMPLLLSILKDNPITSARLIRTIFQNWNCKADADETAPVLFHRLMYQMLYETFADEFGESIKQISEGYQYMLPGFIDMLEKNDSSMFDDKATLDEERRDNIFDRAMLKALRYCHRKFGPYMENWKWGSLHRGKFSAPGYKESANISDEPMSGDFSTLAGGSVKSEGKPVDVLSIAGYAGGEDATLYMNYSYSLDPKSDFFYGSHKSLGIISFSRVFGIYTTTLEK